MTRPTEVFDAGLQPERTGLAWQRTGLAAAGAGALYLHTTNVGGWLLLPGAAMLLLGALILLAGWRRYEHFLRRLNAGAAPGAAWPLAILTIVATVFSVCATAVAIFL